MIQMTTYTAMLRRMRASMHILLSATSPCLSLSITGLCTQSLRGRTNNMASASFWRDGLYGWTLFFGVP